MLIRCGQLTDKTWELFCHGCGAPLDVVDLDCILWHVREEQEPYCMDCDSANCDNIPDALVDNLATYVLFVDGYPITVDWQAEAEHYHSVSEHWKVEFRKYVTDQIQAVVERCACLVTQNSTNNSDGE